ncbi:ATP-binding protein [Botrimarina mediterranea]|uniref:histidine kinase n=1 Tax=Botrimarina mediterranea TaxID=2528022 RepID=A0A518K2N6_9BACT|nr:ATP-binding protein [Botrimarina mediterranea]QDV72040.1 Sensor protein FixL [Botrimarina mediterranea]QDV76581.1 Sensor protein FixL [Planctomycetes bacterium K2D]
MTPSPAMRLQQVEGLFTQSLRELQALTDRVFSFLLVAQWAAAIVCALTLSPRAWVGSQSSPHIHLVAALLVGGLLTVFPVWLARNRSGEYLTRLVITAAQMMFSALLIHLMGGRIEAHFHIFGSLALLSFYRDFRVFVPAVVLILSDHLFRGVYWPQSVFGVSEPALFEALEHGGWVLFETAFLVWGIAQSRDHLWRMAELQASLEEERDTLEARVERRTEQLAEARDYLANVIDSLDARICILDERGVILSTNAAWRRFGEGIESEAIRIGEGDNYIHYCDTLGATDGFHAAELAAGLRGIVAGDPDCFVMEYRHHVAGGEAWFQVRACPFAGASGAAVVVAHVDVTERVNAAASSRREADRAAALSQILSDLPNEVYILRRDDLRFLLVSEGAVRATGYDRPTLLGMSPADLVPNATVEKCLVAVEPLIEGRASMVDFQTLHRRHDGHAYPVQVSVHAANFNGQPVFVAFITDLTEVRRLESRLAQSQKLESIGQLAAGIAHEINTPMQCVSNNVEFLQECHQRLFDLVDRLVKTLDSPARSWDDRKLSVRSLIDEHYYNRVAAMAPSAINEAAEASRRVIEIVRAMKVMSHPGTHDFVDSDLNDGIRNAATIARNRWKYVAEVEFDLDEALPHVPVLPAELNQVFLNLIVNAADAIAEKNGENGPLGVITLRTRCESESVRIEIADNGPGVPEAIRERIFDPFFTTKDVGKGTGQGLAISYDVVVNKHHGTIDVLSTEGEGATFVVCLPMRVEAAEGITEASTSVVEA